jgi:hypothetical protein
MELSSRDSQKPESSQVRADQVASRLGKLQRISRVLKRFVEHPVTQLGVGLILITSSLIEAYDTVLNDLHRFRVRVGHGVIILGVVNVLASLPDVILGIDHWISGLGEGEDSPQSRDGSNG